MLLQPATIEEYLALANRPLRDAKTYKASDIGQLQRTTWIGSPMGDIWSTADYPTGWQYYRVGEEIRKVAGEVLVVLGDLVTEEVLEWANGSR